MGSSKKVLAGILWSVIVNITNALYGFMAIPLLIGYFGKNEYGLIALANSVNAYIQLMDMGLGSTNVRFFSAWLAKNDKDKIIKLFSTSNAFYGLIGVLNAIVLIVVYLLSDKIFNVSEEQNSILRKLLLLLVLGALVNWFTSCYNQLIQATENVAWVQKRNFIAKLLLIFVLFLTIYLKLNIIIYFSLTILTLWIILPFMILKIKSLLPYVSFKPIFDIEIFKEILPYSLNIFLFSIFSMSYQNLRTLFIGIRGSVVNVTEFSVMMGIAGIVSSIGGVFMSALLPSSSKAIANNNKTVYYKIAYEGTKYITLFTGFCVFGIITVSKNLIYIYVGEHFQHILPWLICLLLTNLTNNILAISSLILGGEDIKPLTKMTAISSIIGIVSTWLFIPKYGVGGAIIGTILYNLFQQFYYYFYYWPIILKIDSKKIFFKFTIPIYLFGGVLSALLFQMHYFESDWISLIAKGVTFTIVYLIFLFIFLSKEDINFFRTNLLHN